MRGSLFAQMQRIMRTRATKSFQLPAVVRASSLSQPSPPPSSSPSASAALLASARPISLRPPPSQEATDREAEVPSSSGRTEPVTLDPKLLSGCEPGTSLSVAVLLSGGVDSSVALSLVRAAGHRVKAFYLQIWFQEDFRNFWDQCPWEEDLKFCEAVCAAQGVDLEVVPMTGPYWDRVVSEAIKEIKSGRTPNPDIWCNSRVKFGAFIEYLEEKYKGQYDRVASGHYACVRRPSPPTPPTPTPHPHPQLVLTPDPIKDQTYFLAGLSPAQLARCMFPVGELTKPQVRATASLLDLPNKARKDSQGICFLGKVKFPEFVREHLGDWPGVFIEAESGALAGYHKGFWFYTVGQRQGIRLPGGPWYVVKKDIDRNIVYVSRKYKELSGARREFRCGSFSWLGPRGAGDALPDSLSVKVRHGPNLYKCTFEMQPEGQAIVRLSDSDQGLAAGQYAVFYEGDVCLGSAVIM